MIALELFFSFSVWNSFNVSILYKVFLSLYDTSLCTLFEARKDISFKWSVDRWGNNEEEEEEKDVRRNEGQRRRNKCPKEDTKRNTFCRSILRK